jgi:TolB-like protein/Flp pilus assembly protein TadD
MSASPDIFLSYNREDSAVAKLYAEAFGREGFDVWWDQTLRSGETYDEVTEAALRGAKAVVVLWSPRSVASHWVRAEATIAHRAKSLVPAKIEPCDKPVMFELTQTAELSHWRGEADDQTWRAFLGDVRRMVGAEREPSNVQATSSGKAAPPPEEGIRPSIAILPFASRSRIEEDEYFAEVLVEDLTAALSIHPMLRVVASSATANYRSGARDLRRIGHELAVTYVLEGNVRRAGKDLRTTTQLVEAESGDILWTQKFDRPLTDLSAVQEELVADVAAHLGVQIERANWTRALNTPSNLRSIGNVIQMTRSGYESAVAEARRAIDLAPSYAISHGGLALALAYLWRIRGADDTEMEREIVDAMRRARALDPDNPLTLVSCGGALVQLGKPQDAIPLLTRALTITPASSHIRATLGLALVQLGQAEEGLRELDESERLGPNSIWALMNSVWRSVAHLQLGQIDEALETINKALVLMPESVEALVQNILCLTNQNDWSSARDTMQRLRAADLEMSWPSAEKFVCFLHSGSTNRSKYLSLVRKLWNETEG